MFTVHTGTTKNYFTVVTLRLATDSKWSMDQRITFDLQQNVLAPNYLGANTIADVYDFQQIVIAVRYQTLN